MQFPDEESKNNYQKLDSIYERYEETLATFIPATGNAIYIFPSAEESKIFMQNRVRREGSPRIIQRKSIDPNLNQNSRVENMDTTSSFEHVYYVPEQYLKVQLLGNGIYSSLSDSLVYTNNESKRDSWAPDLNLSSIKVYDDKNFGGDYREILNPNGNYKESTIDNWNEYVVNLGNINFNNRTNSMRVWNASTRRMVARFWKNSAGSGPVLDIELPERLGPAINSGWYSDLSQIKVKPGCKISCEKWGNEISAVSFFLVLL
ncbi:hypothetical protein [Marinoscillum sp. MHG1-6]|uniref:hypothetical protein n=1 Tax=Marinoscillum sp. MHG1-6 TaxID=2959627 RepID=UPI0021579B6E|nr:hypothetical protein [Marinoscillum sp. MHG1-6]